MISEPTAILKRDANKSIKYRHPWIFSGAIKKIDTPPTNGGTVLVIDENGTFLGRGAHSTHSKISIRLWSTSSKEEINEEFFSRKIRSAIDRRKIIHDGILPNSIRLVFAESDELPGLIIDKFSDVIVCQFLSAGAEFWKNTIIKILISLLSPKSIFERSDADIRDKEGLSSKIGLIHGAEIPDMFEICENEIKYLVDIKNGHKTGFYLDQQLNRKIVASYAKDMEVLDCFSYTGGFALNLLKNGAKKVTCIDSSGPALSMLKQNAELNNFDMSKLILTEHKVGDQLRKYRDQAIKFDMIVLDPPKFVNDRSHLDQAIRAYKDINLLAIKLLKSNGILATCSCSQLMTDELFLKMVSYASSDANKSVQILEKITQSNDHPISLNFPESSYLKGLICRVF